jgi:hypothetical protein
MRHKRWIALAVLPALLLAGDFFYWRLAVSHLRDAFETWTRRAEVTGWDIRYGAVTEGGWPNAATLRVEHLTVRTASIFGHGALSFGSLRLDSLAWGSDAILLSTGLARPDTLEVTPVGVSTLRLGDGQPMPVSASHMRLRLTLRPNGSLRVVDLDAVTLAAEFPGPGKVSVGHLSGHADLKATAGRDQPVATFSVSARPVVLPDTMNRGPGNRGPGTEISEFALEGVLNGPMPSGGFMGGQGLTTQAMSWRDEGGSLELHRLAIAWGQVRLDATATLALDEELQPMGAGTGKIVGYEAALDALAANNVLTRSATKAAKAVLSLLATTPSDGEPAQVEVPLTLQFRTLSVRQVPLVRLPEFDWPEHQSAF